MITRVGDFILVVNKHRRYTRGNVHFPIFPVKHIWSQGLNVTILGNRWSVGNRYSIQLQKPTCLHEFCLTYASMEKVDVKWWWRWWCRCFITAPAVIYLFIFQYTSSFCVFHNKYSFYWLQVSIHQIDILMLFLWLHKLIKHYNCNRRLCHR